MPIREEKERRKTPKGHFAVYVGTEDYQLMRRFVVPMAVLKSPLFQQLLEKSAEEYKFDYQNHGIVLPCDESSFRRITSFLDKSW